ncbi:DUF3429 domain-containing protein [Maricaulis parjimensis]|uniref:DUF3429 domain-containing protein n=1 Tax=Maricaulis parjimensis TaxID=144023 RepID=UPI001939A420|nr:DUF3429 domain-containing protein [Maricaulis parjimensis]
MTGHTPIPARALWGGLAGWIPFWLPVALAIEARFTGRSPAAEFALFTLYGALILSFLGGARWGRALAPDNETATWGLALLPTCLGLAAIGLHWALGAPAGIALIILGLCAHLFWDRQAMRCGELPDWYGRLRLVLSAGAILAGLACLGLALL